MGKPLPGLRTVWADYAKAIAILLVVIGHQKLPWPAFQFIYSFHMPFFFLISGYLFSFQKHPVARLFVRHRAKTILLPYASLGLLLYGYWALIAQRFGGHDPIPYWKPLVGMVYGVGTGGWLSHAVLSWFLPCLFMVEILFYFLFRRPVYPLLKLGGLISLALCIALIQPTRLPFGLDIAFTGVLFYWAGHQGKTAIKSFLTNPTPTLLWMVIALAGFTFALATSNGKVDMRDLLYGHQYPLFLLGGLTGSLMLMGLSRIAANVFGGRYWVELIGRNTLITLFFQPIATTMLKVMALGYLSWPKESFTAPHWINLGFASAILALQIPFILVITRYLPFILGRTQGELLPEVAPLSVMDNSVQKL
ncbi:acyltransferase family protein [Spirosoma aerophilum]